MRDWNKGCWSNIVVGILCLTVGSIEEKLIIMFAGMVNLMFAAMYWAVKLGLLKKNDAKEVDDE